MTPTAAARTAHAIRTPRAAAVAGLVFSILFATSAVLTEWAIPEGSDDPGAWATDDARRRAVELSLRLLPFAGIAFLWFIGVIRDRLGEGEDRFFATVFLGSGLLFVAMFFASAAVTAGLLGATADGSADVGAIWPFGQRIATMLALDDGLRMAAVFTISTTTLAARLHIVPRWLAMFGYATAAALLLGVGLIPWVELVFPLWVFVLSVHVLVVQFGDPPVASGGLTISPTRTSARPRARRARRGRCRGVMCRPERYGAPQRGTAPLPSPR